MELTGELRVQRDGARGAKQRCRELDQPAPNE
jgi:hypothetical protein